MNFVEPIRSEEKIEEIKRILKMQSYRNYLMFYFGINTGLRISDILKLKAGDVRNKEFFYVDENKTKKERKIRLRNGLKIAMDEYIKTMDDDTPLFSSQKNRKEPMLRQQAYRIINDACKKAGINDRVGTHTLRKTFSYHHFRKHNNLEILRKILNHSTIEQTREYIGLTEDEIDRTLEDFDL